MADDAAGTSAGGGEVVDFGWGDAKRSAPLSGRRKKAAKAAKEKKKPGTFGEWRTAHVLNSTMRMLPCC